MDEHAPIVYDLTQYKEETKNWNSDPSAYLLRYYTKYYFLSTGGKDMKSGPADQVKIIDQQTGLQVLRGDQYLYQSPNKLCIAGLAPTHPLLSQRDRYKVLSLRFDSKIQVALPQPTAIPANSKKQPPPPCHCETVICKIEALDLWAKQEQEQEQEQEQQETTKATVDALTASATEAESEEKLSVTTSNSTTADQNSRMAINKDSSQRIDDKPRESIDPTRVIFVVRGAISGHVIELNERLLRRDATEITDPVVIETMLAKASTHGFIAVIRPKVDKTEVALKDLQTMEEYDQTRHYKHTLNSNVEQVVDSME
ncbi:hypothetical protein EDD11_005488 [Mortierella claussenii]|nr:hypothetical protein EDD11_005488 [Mortierella claussenii]